MQTTAVSTRPAASSAALSTNQPHRDSAKKEGYRVRTYVVPDDSVGPLLPKGSVVLLHCVAGSDLRVDDFAMCTDLHERAVLLGQVSDCHKGRLYCDNHLTIAQAEAAHMLMANRPYRFWYRLEILCIPCEVTVL